MVAEQRWLELNPGSIVGMLTQCPPCRKWVSGGNTGKIKAGMKRAGRPTSLCLLPRISVLSNKHSPTYGIIYETSL